VLTPEKRAAAWCRHGKKTWWRSGRTSTARRPFGARAQWGGGKSHDFGPSRFSIASRLEDGEALIIHDHRTKIVGSRWDR
jgi:hypothetical protein